MHFTGHIMAEIRNAANDSNGGDYLTVDNLQQNATCGIHQARVRLAGDATVYRLILAPADAPIMVGKQPITDHFAKPLGEM